MKKEKFLISTIILIIGGALTKVFGIFIRIIMTRIVGSEGISLYMLIFPTFSLFMTLSQLGFPIAISKLIAEDNHNNKNIIFSIIPFSLMLNTLLILVIFIIAPTLSTKLLKDPRSYYPILAIALVLPFDSLSSILRGYFFGKQKMLPHVISNVFEQIVRLILIILLVPRALEKSLVFAVSLLVGVNIISELSSSLILLLFFPRNAKITSSDIRPNVYNVKEVLRIALPTTMARLVGSIGYFFEPILITTAGVISGIGSNILINDYGIVEGYVMPLLLLPGFFSNAISSALLPVVTKAYYDKQIDYVKKKLKQAVFYSLLIGVPVTIILFIFPEFFLKLIYNTSYGVTYLRVVAPFFLIYYVQAPLASVLQSINLSKYIMLDNLVSIIIKSIIIFSCCFFWGIYGFLISICSNILIVTILHYKHIKKALKQA